MTDRVRESAEQAAFDRVTIKTVHALRGPSEITSPAVAKAGAEIRCAIACRFLRRRAVRGSYDAIADTGR